MTSSFPRLAPFALMASAQACTLTAEDFSPQLASSIDGTASDTSETGAQPESDGDALSSTAGRMNEGLAPDTLVGNGAVSPGSTSPDAGASGDGGAAPVALLPELVGWASVPGLGLATTTGGGAAPAVLARTARELIELAARPEPLNIAIAGALDVGRLDLTSNKTLFGTNADATLRGGISVRGTPDSFVRNVIVHNLNIDAVSSLVQGDGIEVRYAHHVWIDHCELRDAADGLLDIVRGSDFITVSRTRFLYTAAAPDPTHRFAVLVGHDVANAAEDEDHLNVTWHHNYWSDDVARALLGRFGNLHLFNNLFASSGNESVLQADIGARLLVENNVFSGVTSPHAILPGTTATLEASGNVYLEAPGDRDVAGLSFMPPYDYELESPLTPIVTNDVGPQ